MDLWLVTLVTVQNWNEGQYTRLDMPVGHKHLCERMPEYSKYLDKVVPG